MASLVAGTGTITCVGNGVSALWDAALSGRTGIVDGLGLITDETLVEARAQFSRHPYFKNLTLPESRSKELALLTLQQAMADAGWDELTERDGLILATTTGQIPVWDKALTAYLEKSLSKDEFVRVFSHQPLGDLLRSLTAATGFRGRQMLVASACSASTQALALGSMWLEEGLVERCVVGGVEVLCALTVNGFASLQLLSRQASRPFDSDREGINLSEGTGFVCLTKDTGTPGKALLRGYGMTSDGHHMTAPSPEGRGSKLAMAEALEVAELEPTDIDWVHAHGTGSAHNDGAEALAIQNLFGSQRPWVSSSKWVHGHALGASGVIESILCIEALNQQTVLKTHGLQEPDATLNIRHPMENRKTKLRHILKNTSGFGGTNAALVWSGVKDL